MKNLELNGEKLKFSNGDFELIEGLELVKQEIIIGLHTFLHDWLLDRNKGIDYFRDLKADSTAFLENDIKETILGINNVLSIDKISVSFNQENLHFTVIAIITTTFGKISLNETSENLTT